MLAYIARRLLFIVPTLFAIMVVNFVIVQFVPGGPVERILAELEGVGVGATARIAGSGGELAGAAQATPRARASIAARAGCRKASSTSWRPCTASTSHRWNASR